MPKETSFDLEDECFFSCLWDQYWIPKYSQLIQQFGSLNKEALIFTLRNVRTIHEFINEEFIEQLSLYLINRFQDQKLQPQKVLEICAGDGLLSHHLNQKLKTFNIEVIPTDAKISHIPECFSVEELNHQQALKKYPYPIVLCSWMPRNVDLTPALRQSPSTSEYILIGDPYVCGTVESWCPEYPNFQRHPIESVHKFQFGLTDSPLEGISASQIYSFRRINLL